MTLNAMRRGIVRTALRLYPRWWRERYGDELQDLLDEEPFKVGVLADITRAAVRERIAHGLAWPVGLTALLALGPFLVVYYFLPLAMTGRMNWGDPLLSLIIEPGPVVNLWIVPLVVGVMLSLLLRRSADPEATSRWSAAWCGLSCAVVGHAVLLVENIGHDRLWSFLLSMAWWREVYPQMVLLYLGFDAIGLIAHRLIVVPPSSKRLVSAR